MEVRISKFRQKMHLSTVKVPIDFGIDWPQSSVLFYFQTSYFFQTLLQQANMENDMKNILYIWFSLLP